VVVAGVLAGVAGYLGVADQVSTCSFRGGEFRRGYQERAGLCQCLGVPSGREHSLPEDQVNVAAFPDSQAYPDVHLRPHGVAAHGLLRRSLGSGEQVSRDGPAAPRE
jgi:hypothetical protein